MGLHNFTTTFHSNCIRLESKTWISAYHNIGLNFQGLKAGPKKSPLE